MKTITLYFKITVIVFAFGHSLLAFAEKPSYETERNSEGKIIVTRDNFVVAETDHYFKNHTKEHPVNTIRHSRAFSTVESQVVIRENKDCLYSHAVVDISKGAVIKNPEWIEGRYSIIQVLDENQYSFAHLYPGDSVTITPDDVSMGNYVWLNIRTEVRPWDGEGFYEAHKHQDGYVIKAASAKPYEPKGFDEKSLAEVRTELLKESPVILSWQSFGTKEAVDPEMFVIAAAGGWAGLPKEHAVYWPKILPTGKAAELQPSKITIPKAPLDYDKGGFFSATVYGPDAFIATKNYALSSRTAEMNEDGSMTIYFNAPGKPNNLQTVKGWNMTLRFYLPTSHEAMMSYIDDLGKNNVQIEPLAFSMPLHAEDIGQVVPPKSAAEVPGPVAGAPLTKEYVKAVGRMAYLWGWPMVNMHNRQATFAKVPYPGLLGGVLPVGPANEIGMLSDYVAPEQRFVACPNQDVVYGAGFLDLGKEPAVIQVPYFGDRFWVYQIVDQRTDSFARMGKQYATNPGLYLLVGPEWKGEKPEGITAVYRSSTNIGGIIPRIFMDDTDADRSAVQPLVNQVMVYPLSKFTGKMQTTDWSAAKTIPQPETDGDEETAWVVPSKFFDQLPAVLDEVPPLPGEEAMYAWFRQVLEAADKDPALKQALVDVATSTEEEILNPMFEFRGNAVDAGNQWRTQKNSARFGYDYFQRTATAKGNMFSNMPDETVYFGADFDSNGNRITGLKSYTVTFRKGELPPVNGFWSLTLYNKQHFFHPNDLKRFSLGTKNKDLKYGQDGSLTIYVQSESPGADKESNWLPAPADDDYSLYIRAYWPKEAATNGEWAPPAIKPTK